MGWNLHLGSRRAHVAPLKLLTLFVLLSGIPLAALGWLGWRVLQQDRALESQRVRERLDSAAGLVARELDRTLSAWETLLPAASEGQPVALPVGGIFLLIAEDGVAGQQGIRLPYYPRVAPSITADASLFATAEQHEFREQNLTAAIAAYRALSVVPDPATRGGALLRLARCLRKQGRAGDALSTYADLAALPAVFVAGSPAELVARRERIALFDATGDAGAAARERRLLESALNDGRFQIDRVTFDHFYGGGGTAPPAAASTVSLAQAIESVWPAWHEHSAGRLGWTNDRDAFVTTWRKTPHGIATITAPLDALTASVGDTLLGLQVSAQLADPAGKPVWGTAAGTGIIKTARETGLPWSLHVTSPDPPAVFDSRRNLLMAGFALMSLVVLAASYVAFRAVTRELAVARLQSDFVAAVSHEFRTPLTAMCHLTEMLEHGDAAPERRAQYYQALGKESRRLRTMVESLLDFGRMDSGERSYDFAATDAVQLVDQVVQEFASRSTIAARRIDTSSMAAGSAVCVRADREALALALRNLLDNAMKYSPEAAPVRLAVTTANGMVAVSVEDHGPGVSAEERRAIFRKFTRGTAARRLNVKGTGIGLTMAHQIVKAHGGRLELDSEAGRGSIFTMILPVMAP